jgi:outer membrane protein TolC
MKPKQRVSCAAVLLLAVVPTMVVGQAIIGVVADGPVTASRKQISIGAIERELTDLLGDDVEVSFPARYRVDGGWTEPGVRQALTGLLSDPAVDIVLTTGLVAGSEASQIDDLPKPVVAIVVGDNELQNMPMQDDGISAVSGKDNFVYLTDFQTIEDEINAFHGAVPFDHLGVLVDELTLTAIPALAAQKAGQIEAQLGVDITIVPVTNSAMAALARLPSAVDAVYVSPLLRFDDGEMQRLSDGMIDRGLPSFSLLGFGEVVDYGLLMATGGRREDTDRRARRVALNLARILDGENPAAIEVLFRESRRLTINMHTADRIGFAPSYAILADAEQFPPLQIESGEPLSLAMAMQRAVDFNLRLKVQRFNPLLSAEAAQAARAALKPRIGFGLQTVTIDEDRANPLIQSERSTQADLSGSQLIYSDDVRARIRLAENLKTAADFDYDTAILDTMQEAARAYLTVLRARALERIQRDNLELTRDNLQLAQIRERIEFSGRADRLRWESQLATDRQNVIAAEADRRAALTAFNRILNRSQNESFTVPEEDVSATIGLFQDKRFQVYIDNAVVWEVFQDFSVAKAIEASPELSRIDALVSAQERQLLSSQRKHWLPEFALGASAGSVLRRGGAGSSLTGTGLDDESWSVALTASLPVFTGGALRARVDSDRYALEQLEQSRAALTESLEARTRLALHRASGSYPAIATARTAYEAAAENYELVNEAYSQGVASVTDLIDAQRAANLAELRATDTQYAALIDVIDVFRSSADFSVLLDQESSDAWYQEIQAYFEEHGVEPRR